MPSDSAALPKYRQPPLVEVVHGVQFERLPITIVHPGLFYARISDRFPVVQSQPTLPPLRPMFEIGPGGLLFQPPFQLADPNEVPRAWFIAQDGATLVQMQNDRLLFNWRHEPSKAKYPHFEDVHAGFTTIYSDLARFVTDEKLGELKPQICEMTYINHIRPRRPDGRARPAHEVLRVLPENFGPEWGLGNPDAINWSARYVLRRAKGEPYGRLSTNLLTISQMPSPEQILQLEISVHGVPDSADLDGVIGFHQLAHEMIVNHFTAITTKTAHNEWERFQ